MMTMQSWLKKNAVSLIGKTVVITGATGGLGSAACRYFLSMGADILMVNRNREKSEALCAALRQEFPQGKVRFFLADLEEIFQVENVCKQLLSEPVDILMLNAGTYANPRALCSTGYDNVFETNFLSHYYMVHRLLPLLSQRKAKVVATGSIAHRFVSLDPGDPDYAHHEGAEKIYGNSKRFLMFALTELLRQEKDIRFAIGHPGISFTGITSHYPKNQLAFVKFSMRLIFMWPQKAVRSIVKAAIQDIPELSWFGPKFFDIWGNPARKPLESCKEEERQQIFEIAENMYQGILMDKTLF